MYFYSSLLKLKVFLFKSLSRYCVHAGDRLGNTVTLQETQLERTPPRTTVTAPYHHVPRDGPGYNTVCAAVVVYMYIAVALTDPRLSPASTFALCQDSSTT